MRSKWILTSVLVLAALCAGAVWAAEAGKAKGGWRGGKQHGQFMPPVMGVITAIEGQQITIKPEIPAEMASRMAQKGVSPPQLPDSIIFWIGAETKVHRNGGESADGSFSVGERIVAMLDGDPASGKATARRVADEATAQQFMGRMRERGEQRKQRMEEHGRPLMGSITAIEGSTVTIKPELPEQLREKLLEHGRATPELPASLSFTVSSETVILRQNGAAQLSDFKPGEQVVVMVKGDVRGGTGIAVKLADIETARSMFREKAGEIRQRWQSGDFPHSFAPMNSTTDSGPRGLAEKDRPKGEGRSKGKGEGRGEGKRGPRPHFGTVIKVDGSSITIKPEVPDFLKDLHPGAEPERGSGKGEGRPGGAGGPGRGPGGGAGPRDLPVEISVKLSSKTEYFQNNKAVSKNPFKAGDKVAVMPGEGSERGNINAAAVSDYATAEARLKEKMKHGGPGKGKGQGAGKDKPKHRPKDKPAGGKG